MVRSLRSFSTLRKIMNGVRLTVGQIRNLRIAHSVVVVIETQALKVPRWRRWATMIGEVNPVDVPAMVRAVGVPNEEHAQQELDTILDLLEAADDESVQIDGFVPPRFGEWA